MTIIRTVKDKDHPYKVINSTCAEDQRLSIAARGMMFYLLVKPDDWQIRVVDLMRQLNISRDKAYKTLNELRTAGYVVYEKIRDERGVVIEHAYTIHEHPLPSQPDLDNPESGVSRSGEPSRLLNKKSTNYEVTKYEVGETRENETATAEAAQPLAAELPAAATSSQEDPEGIDNGNRISNEGNYYPDSRSDPYPPISAAPPSPRLAVRHSPARDDDDLGHGTKQSSFVDAGPSQQPQRRRSSAAPLSPAAQIYRDVVCLSPSKAQRSLFDAITDLDLWRETLAYWVGRGWSPRNISGMISRYQSALGEKEKAAAVRDAALRETEERRRRAQPLTAEQRRRNLELLDAARSTWRSAAD